jgi:hypothetical protein
MCPSIILKLNIIRSDQYSVNSWFGSLIFDLVLAFHIVPPAVLHLDGEFPEDPDHPEVASGLALSTNDPDTQLLQGGLTDTLS